MPTTHPARSIPHKGLRSVRPSFEALEDRLVLNSRFVVPVSSTADNVATFHTLSAALTTPGLAADDVVQIEPGSAPGAIGNSDIDAIDAINVTIRGNANTAPEDLPGITTSNAITLDAAEVGLTFSNVNLQLNHTLSFNANGAIRDSLVTIGSTGNDGIQLLATTAAVLWGNRIVNNGVTSGNDIIQVNAAANTANQIVGNTITSTTGSGYTLYYHATGSVTITDQVAWNTFIGANVQETSGARMILVSGDVTGLSIVNNRFQDDTAEYAAIYLFVGPNNVLIQDNVFKMIYDATPQEGAILVDGANGTSAVIKGNSFTTGANGRGIEVRMNSATSVDVRVEANDFQNSTLGILIGATSATAEVGDVDLGGGLLGGLGVNNFRTFKAAATTTAGAIVVNAGTADVSAATINAQNNIFGLADPQTVIRDRADDATEASVVTTGNLTGATAFVQSLYVNFLGRAGDSAGVAGFVALADAGNLSGTAAAIIRSTEALTREVASLYQTILRRAGGASEVASWVSVLQAGATLEQVTAYFYGSSEYASRYGAVTNESFVKHLYRDLLGRVGDSQDVTDWANLLDTGTLTREQVVAQFLNSTEYRTRFVTDLYANLLKREASPTAEEVNSWVQTGRDLLSIRVAFAGSIEYSVNG